MKGEVCMFTCTIMFPKTLVEPVFVQSIEKSEKYCGLIFLLSNGKEKCPELVTNNY